MSSLFNTLAGTNDRKRPQGAAPGTKHKSGGDESTSQQSLSWRDRGGDEQEIQPSDFADPTRLHPLAGVNRDTLEYLTLDESTLSSLPGSGSVIPSRGWADDLCYGTGASYLAALSLGGAWGMREGVVRSAGQPPRLLLNSILNSVTRRGPFLGNSVGVVAILYNSLNSAFGFLRGKHDAINTIGAGGLSGMLFKSTRGVRPMLISGCIVASAAGCWALSMQLLAPKREAVSTADGSLLESAPSAVLY